MWLVAALLDRVDIEDEIQFLYLVGPAGLYLFPQPHQ